MTGYSTMINGRRLTLLQGDITVQDAEAIVNAANSALLGGGGVDGAIHRAAGEELLEECKRIKRTVLKDSGGLLPTGQAVMTGGCNLAAKYVIHTVGPVYRQVDNPGELLRNAYDNSLRLAEETGIRSVAFPSIGTGVYGCPLEWAAKIALSAIGDALRRPTSLQDVRMVLFTRGDYEVYRRTLAGLTGSADPCG